MPSDKQQQQQQQQQQHQDSLGSPKDPRWRIPTHSQQHPSDSSYRLSGQGGDTNASTTRATNDSSSSAVFPEDLSGESIRILASRAGEYKVAAPVSQPTGDSSSASTSAPASIGSTSASHIATEWIPKSRATARMVDAWRSGRKEREKSKQRSRRGQDRAAFDERKRKRGSASSSESDAAPDADTSSLAAAPRRPQAKRTASKRPDQPVELFVDVPYASQGNRFVPYLSMTQSTLPEDAAPRSQVSPVVEAEEDETEAAAPSGDATDLQPLRSIPTEAFVPYLDDDTGVDIDAAGRPLARLPPAPPRPRDGMAVAAVAATAEDIAEVPTQDRSSPVDQFSQSQIHSVSPPRARLQRSPSPLYQPDQVPRIGSWIVPKPPIRLGSHLAPPPPTTFAASTPTEEAAAPGAEEEDAALPLTQQLDSDEDLDFEEGEDRVAKLLEELERRKANAKVALLTQQSSDGVGTPPPGPAAPPVSQPSGYLAEQSGEHDQEEPLSNGQAGGEGEAVAPRESTLPAARAESTPAAATATREVSSRRVPLPSQSIASQPPPPPATGEDLDAAAVEQTPRRTQPQHAPPAVPEQPTPTISSSQPMPYAHRLQAGTAAAVATPPTSSLLPSDTSLSSSQGWSTLPRREICELLHRSTHIPVFLKDELEQYVMRSKRASHSQRSATTASQAHPLTQSQSQSQSQSDSETQEDGFLRIKAVWCFDLLRETATEGATGLMTTREGQKTVWRFTQSQQSGGVGGVGGSTTSTKRTVILLIDTREATFDVQEIEESLASILREDKRFGAWFDAEGRRFPSAPSLVAARAAPVAATAAAATSDDEIAKLRQELRTLQSQLTVSQAEVAHLSATIKTSESDLAFLRDLYDKASTSSAHYRTLCDAQTDKITTLQAQLSEGLDLHRRMAVSRADTDGRSIMHLSHKLAFLQEQQQRTGDEIRRKAAMWDSMQAEEEDRRVQNEERKKKARERRMLLQREMGLSGVAEGEGEGEGGGEEETMEDELAALRDKATMAAESIGSVAAEIDVVQQGRTRRSRRARTSIPSPSTPPITTTTEELDMVTSLTDDLVQQRQDEVRDELEQFWSVADDAAGESVGVVGERDAQGSARTLHLTQADTSAIHTQP